MKQPHPLDELRELLDGMTAAGQQNAAGLAALEARVAALWSENEHLPSATPYDVDVAHAAWLAAARDAGRPLWATTGAITQPEAAPWRS